ncbi:MAG: hypothetical protein HY689_08615 [Chloroflexi bacterium]|nr:hypothetical protein [Chloroflexota bacterium]
MLASVLAMALVVFLMFRPIDEVPPPVVPEAAASFDRKLAGLMAGPGGTGEVAFAEQELNAKLAQTLTSAPSASPLKSIFVRLRPENRMTAVGLAEVMGRPVGGIAELRLVSEGGVSVTIESARIGALPLPVGLFTQFVFPMMQSAGISPPTPSAMPATIKSARTDGANLILSGR